MDITSLSLTYSLWNNSLMAYLTALGLFLALSIAFGLTQAIVIGRIEKLSQKTKSDLDDLGIALVRSVRLPLFTFLAFLFASKTLTLSPFFTRLSEAAILITLTYQAVLTLGILIDYSVDKLAGKSANSAQETTLTLLGKIVKGVLWVIGALLVLQNFGVNVTSLIAGLGIGGIAVGFALQNILEDVFSSFAIIFDKPFKPGDYIVTGAHSGTVEKIGIKTTRIRALQGEEIVISNKELTSTRVQNFKRMQKRRVNFSLGLAYSTPSKKLKGLIKKIEKVIGEREIAEFDRAHFSQFGDSALIVEVVYHIASSEYNVYMDTHQEILFDLKEYCEKQGIEIAFPSQTVYLEN